MEFSNYYTVEALQYLNNSQDYRYDVSQSDSDKVNRLIEYIQRNRDKDEIPLAGDIIEYTTLSGDYYACAHIERIKDGCGEICLSSFPPFCYEEMEEVGFNAGGGTWAHVETAKLEPVGIRIKLFKTWGHCGRCANGAVYFNTFVRVWKYTEPEPVFGKYTTKDWTKYFISKMPDPEKPGEFTYLGNSFADYSEAEFDRLVHILHGKVFDGVYHNSLVLWGYRMNWKCLAEEEWNGIKANVHLSFLGNSPVKIQIEQEKHVVTIYKKCDNNNRI